MSEQAAKADGLKLRIGQYQLRIWKYGFEYGNRLGGKYRFFPWNCMFREWRYLREAERRLRKGSES